MRRRSPDRQPLGEGTQTIPSPPVRTGQFGGRSNPLGWLSVCIGLAAVPGLILIDRGLMASLQSLQWPPFVELMRRITWLGYGALDVGLLAVLAAYGWWDGDARLRARGIAGALTVAGAGLLDQVLKNVACRARPNAPQAGAFFSSFPCFPASYAHASFPSGHATTAFATALILAFWYPRQTGLFVGLAGLVGMSRVVLGSHFPSDVLAGAVLGSGVALIVHAYLPMVRKGDAEEMRPHTQGTGG